MRVVCLLRGGKDYLIKDSSGKEWKFEDHPYCGPTVLNKKGDPAPNQPNGKSLLWVCINLWITQGKKSNYGVCIYELIEEKKPILKHMGGRHYKIVGYK